MARYSMLYKETIFFIPVWLGDYRAFTGALRKTGKWDPIPREEMAPRYLMRYVGRIAENPSLFSAFRLKPSHFPNVYMFQDKLHLSHQPALSEIRFSCFATGAGFLEFRVAYGKNTLEEVVSFSYLFKKSAKGNGKQLPDGSVSLYKAAESLLPPKPQATLFFTKTARFKQECLCYHYVSLEAAHNTPDYIDRNLSLLKRSYNESFRESTCQSRYDMTYAPYPYDFWAGSPEGLVNITCESGQDNTDYFLHHYKKDHLTIDYYFCYLPLLNQRFSAIAYICEIAEAADAGQRAIEQLNRRIVRLKTVFSFSVISDDQIYQNVYSQMYQVLDIDRLLENIRDNENQMEIIQNARSVRADKSSNKFLFGISLLSLFSALIDASSYFDRIGALQPIATQLGLCCTLGIVITCILWLVSSRDR